MIEQKENKTKNIETELTIDEREFILSLMGQTNILILADNAVQIAVLAASIKAKLTAAESP